jgi:ketosteroid isomerase-like protein
VDAAGCRQRLKHTRVHWTSTVSHSTWPYGPSPQPGTGEQLHADLVLLGTAADERRIGIDGARSQFERDISQSESRSLKIGWTSISAAGDVAWLAAELTVTAVANRESVTFLVRLTAVFEQRDGTWKIAQAHLSVPDSSTSEGQSFPT